MGISQYFTRMARYRQYRDKVEAKCLVGVRLPLENHMAIRIYPGNTVKYGYRGCTHTAYFDRMVADVADRKKKGFHSYSFGRTGLLAGSILLWNIFFYDTKPAP